MGTDRRYLFKKSDGYLFSFDASQRMTQAGRGWNLIDDGKGTRDPFDVFHVQDETVVNDRDAVLGSVLAVIGHADFRSYGDAASTTGRMVLRTRDGVVIEAKYYGTSRLPELGQRKLLTATDPEPMEVKLSYFIRFDTESAKYRWLVQTACVGFGRGVIKAGSKKDTWDFPEEFTFDSQVDVYALS